MLPADGRRNGTRYGESSALIPLARRRSVRERERDREKEKPAAHLSLPLVFLSVSFSPVLSPSSFALSRSLYCLKILYYGRFVG